MYTYVPTGQAPGGEPAGRSGLGSFLSPSLALATLALGAVGGAVLVSRSPLVAVAFVLACGLFLGFLAKPSALAVLVVALVPTVSGLRRGFPIPGLRLSEALIVVAAAVILARPAPPTRARWTSLDWVVLAYTVGGPLIEAGDVLATRGHFDSASVQTMLGPLQFLLLYRVLAVALRGDRVQVQAQRALLLSSLPVSILAIAEALGPPSVKNFLVSLTDTTVYITPGWTPVPRASSVFPIWLSLAGYLMIPMLLAVSLLLGRVRDVLPRWVLLSVLVLGLGGLLASLTITIMLAVMAGTIYLGYRYRRLVLVASVGAVVGLLAIVPFWSLVTLRAAAQHQSVHQTANYPFLPQTIAYRVQIWVQQYLPALKGHWATGYGPGFPPGVRWGHTESGYITLLLRGGLPYLAIGALLIWFSVSRARTEAALAATPDRRALCEAIAVIALLQPVINLVFPYMIDSGMAQPLWVMFGLLAAGPLPPRPASPSQPARKRAGAVVRPLVGQAEAHADATS